jgi:hypothetical protein
MRIISASALLLLVLSPRSALAQLVRTSSVEVLLSGYIHAEGVLSDQSSVDEVNPSTGEPLNQNRFLIRRAILRADARYRLLSSAIEIDAETVKSPVVRVIVAEVSARWPIDASLSTTPLGMGTLGLFIIPFGYETQQRPIQRLFFDASNMTRALFPGFYDMGLRIQGGWEVFRYQLAVMNGHPLGELGFGGRDPTAAKDVLGRMGVDANVSPELRIEAGFSALMGTGFHQGTPATKDQIVWRDQNGDGIVELPEIQVIGGTPATPSQSFDHAALGGDIRVHVIVPYLGELLAFGELIWARNLDRGMFIADPVATGRDMRERGFAVGITQEIFEPFIIGARYDRYDPDADATTQIGDRLVPSNSSVSTLALVAALRYVPYGKLALEYDHNDNALGRGQNGVPARLADDRLTLRAEAAF